MINFLGHRFDLVEYDRYEATLITESLDMRDIENLEKRIEKECPDAKWVVKSASYDKFRLAVSKIPVKEFKRLHWEQQEANK